MLARSLSLSLSPFWNAYIHIHIYVYVCVYIYTHLNNWILGHAFGHFGGAGIQPSAEVWKAVPEYYRRIDRCLKRIGQPPLPYGAALLKMSLGLLFGGSKYPIFEVSGSNNHIG